MPGLSAWRPSPIGNGNQLSQYYAPASSASVASHTGDVQTESAHWIWAVGMPATTVTEALGLLGRRDGQLQTLSGGIVRRCSRRTRPGVCGF